jgi:GntR family transcriptional regulator, phosphonate transport system regulatory protein
MRGLDERADEASYGGVTLWRRIADEFEQAISTGTFRAGERLPAETEIAGQFGVNRHTVRRALAALAERGLIRAERGSGTFVEMGRLAYPIGARTRFSEIVGTAGHEAGGRLLGSERVPAARDIAEALDLAPGTEVIRLDILRSADRTPICHAASFLPADRCAGAARIYRAKRSMTATLKHFGIDDYRRQSTRVTAAIADAVDAERLRLAPGRPLLVVESVDVASRGRPVVATWARFAADRVSLVMES